MIKNDFACDAETRAELSRLDELARAGVVSVPDSKTIAFIVRLWRSQRGWKQQTLSSFARVSLATVERVERSQSVSVASLERIAEAFGQQRGIFTTPRVPLSAQAAIAYLEDSMRPLNEAVHVAVSPLRGHRQILDLARSDFHIIDVQRLSDNLHGDAAGLRDWIDLAGFLIEAEEPDSIVDLGSQKPTKRRDLYESILNCVREIERRGHAVALAGTYSATTGVAAMPEAKIALVVFFSKLTDPGAINRRTLYAPPTIDLIEAMKSAEHD